MIKFPNWTDPRPPDWQEKEDDRKLAALTLMNEAYPLRSRQEYSDETIIMFLRLLLPYRAEYIERAVDIAVVENTFLPVIADLVSIIRSNKWREIDAGDYRFKNEIQGGPLKPGELEVYLDEQDAERNR